MKGINKFIPQIDCSIFLGYRDKIEMLSQSISGAKIISDEVDKAYELLKIVNILLDCGKYDEKKEDCINCHFILNLRKETALFIIKINGMEVSG